MQNQNQQGGYIKKIIIIKKYGRKHHRNCPGAGASDNAVNGIIAGAVTIGILVLLL